MINSEVHARIFSEEIGRGWIIFKDGSSLPIFEEGTNCHRDVVYREAERLLEEKKAILKQLKV